MSEALLTVKGLVKSFNGHTILDGIDLEVKRGEVVVIIGPSGCGKSTLLRCINALEKTDSGEVVIDGTPIRYGSKDLPKIRQHIGMVFQSYDLFPHKSVLHNITLAPIKVQKRERVEAEEEARTWLKRVGLSEKADSFPRQLSGGQKQRVAIVRALCMHPEIMLFDEVTAALDPEMEHEVLNVILSLAGQGRTMLIVTHEMDFARAIADRIVFIDDGHVIEEGTPDEFFSSPMTQRARDFLKSFEYSKISRKTNLSDSEGDQNEGN